jgi:hypothetical protein
MHREGSTKIDRSIVMRRVLRSGRAGAGTAMSSVQEEQVSRASQARRIAAAAAFGGTGLTALGAAGFGVLVAEAKLARRWIGQPFGAEGPDATASTGTVRAHPSRWR